MSYKIKQPKRQPSTNPFYLDWKKQRQLKIEQNKPLFEKRMKIYNERKGIREGDYIQQPNGTLNRVTYIWRDEHNKPFQYQTGGDRYGQFYLGNGYLSYSGSLDSGFKTDDTKFKLTKRKLKGQVWLFDRDFATAGGGVDAEFPFRVWKSDKNER